MREGKFTLFSPDEGGILLAQVSQRLRQVNITHDVLDREVGESPKLLDLTQASRAWPVKHRMHLLWVRFDTILANHVTQARQLSLTPNTFQSLDQQLVITLLSYNCLKMLRMLSSNFAKYKYVINEDTRDVRQFVLWVSATISTEVRGVDQVVHDRLKCSWCISQYKGQDLELVMTKRSPKCSLGLIFIFQQNLMKARCCIQAREMFAPNSLSNKSSM